MEQTRNEKGQFVVTEKKERFTTQKIESRKFELSGAYYVVSRGRQEIPMRGNLVIVTCQVFLPSTENGKQADVNLLFGCSFMGKALNWYWGKFETPGYVSITDEFKSDTWRDAFGKASQYAEEEIQKIEGLIDARHQALIDAGY